MNGEAQSVAQSAYLIVHISRPLIEPLQEEIPSVLQGYRRASASIALLACEGVEASCRFRRARCFAGARAAALECEAILDLLALLGQCSEEELEPVRAAVEHVTSMLTALLRYREAA